MFFTSEDFESYVPDSKETISKQFSGVWEYWMIFVLIGNLLLYSFFNSFPVLSFFRVDIHRYKPRSCLLCLHLIKTGPGIYHTWTGQPDVWMQKNEYQELFSVLPKIQNVEGGPFSLLLRLCSVSWKFGYIFIIFIDHWGFEKSMNSWEALDPEARGSK